MAAESEYDVLKLENQLCFPLYACSRSIVNLYTPFLKPLGLTYTQYIVFLVLWEQDGITVGELGTKLHLDNGTITPLLKKMQDKGFVTRERSKSDERVVIVSLTDEGRALREEAVKIPPAIGQCVPLEPDEAAALYELLYKVLGKFSN